MILLSHHGLNHSGYLSVVEHIFIRYFPLIKGRVAGAEGQPGPSRHPPPFSIFSSSSWNPEALPGQRRCVISERGLSSKTCPGKPHKGGRQGASCGPFQHEGAAARTQRPSPATQRIKLMPAASISFFQSLQTCFFSMLFFIG